MVMINEELNFSTPACGAVKTGGGRLTDLARPAVRMARRTMRRMAARVAPFLALARGSGIVAALRFVALSAIGVRRAMQVRLFGVTLTLRTASPDLGVAMATLNQEFEVIAKDVASSRRGLVVDAGGYIGTAAIRLAQLFPGARIVTVEPSRENFALLVENVRPFPNIVPLNAALTAEGAAPTLTLFDRGTGEFGFTIVGDAADSAARGGARQMYEVPTYDMNRLMREHDAASLLFLKLDIEGAELDLLRGGRSWLDRVEVVMVELHDRIVSGCSEAFETATRGRASMRRCGEKRISFLHAVA